jgi:hypothetical protein
VGFDAVGDGTPTSYAELVLSDHPVGYWRFGDAPGATLASDASGNLHPGVFTANGVTLAQAGAIAGDPDQAARFDGSTGCAAVGIDEAFDFSGNHSYSVEVWMDVSQPPDGIYRHPFWRSDPSLSSDYGLFVNGPTGLGFERIVAANRMLAGIPAPPLTAFHHVVGTYDGATGALTLYLDSVEVATVIDTRAQDPLTGALDVGCRPSNTTGFDDYAGTLDEAAIYDFALSPARIAAHWHLGSSR